MTDFIKFKRWAEAAEDIYGFAPPAKPRVDTQDDDLPIRPFALVRMLDRLERTEVGDLPMRRPFEDQVQWGDDDGAVRARLTPNKGVAIERMGVDLRGRPVWVSKRLFKIKSHEFAGHEDVVAGEIAEHVQEVALEPVDAPARHYRQLAALTNRLADRLRDDRNPVFSFQEVKRVGEQNYNILMSIANYGQGKLVSRLKPGPSSGGIIDISFDPEAGTIKGILTTIEVEDSGAWEIDVPYFMGTFMPSQTIDEIATAVLAGLHSI